MKDFILKKNNGKENKRLKGTITVVCVCVLQYFTSIKNK